MKIVFFGASSLGFKCCESIINSDNEGYNVVGIFTIPQTFDIKYKGEEKSNVTNYLHQDFNVLGEEYDIPVYNVNQNIGDFYEDFKALQPDIIVAVGWYYMIPQRFIDLCPKDACGIHGSLLPKYRGNAPLVWAMINGEKETGLSLFYFAKETDAGDIIAQRSFAIGQDENIADLLLKLEEGSLDVLKTELPKLAADTSSRTKQDHKQATYFEKRTPADGEIDWSWDAERIRNFIKAQTKPYPGAFTIINKKKVTIWDADIS